MPKLFTEILALLQPTRSVVDQLKSELINRKTLCDTYFNEITYLERELELSQHNVLFLSSKLDSLKNKSKVSRSKKLSSSRKKAKVKVLK